MSSSTLTLTREQIADWNQMAMPSVRDIHQDCVGKKIARVSKGLDSDGAYIWIIFTDGSSMEVVPAGLTDISIDYMNASDSWHAGRK